jgi:RNA 3'-terminal phosphate cyclase
VSFSPTFISQQFVFFPLLSRLGFDFEYNLLHPGLGMKKMGKVQLSVGDLPENLSSITLVDKGEITKIKLFISLK